ncbi:MAG: MarC family protein [Phycisphaerales bacterium]|nr:MarC family protein [Phycisphaerales bacterium]
MQAWFNVYLKFFFLLTPFFALSMFIAMTSGWDRRSRRKLAVRVSLAVIVLCSILFLFGGYVFEVFGITLDAFRIGAGALLFLSGLSLSRGDIAPPADSTHDIAVVPLAVPITVGPATTGALLVMGGEVIPIHAKIVAGSAMLAAALCIGMMLFVASEVERYLSRTSLAILSRLTGLILVSMAAQMIFAGARELLWGAAP